MNLITFKDMVSNNDRNLEKKRMDGSIDQISKCRAHMTNFHHLQNSHTIPSLTKTKKATKTRNENVLETLASIIMPLFRPKKPKTTTTHQKERNYVRVSCRLTPQKNCIFGERQF